jgi:urate oxidase
MIGGHSRSHPFPETGMLADSAYGKSKIRLVKVSRGASQHDLRDLTIAIQFKGDYDESYTLGDNSSVLPTDTMKNTVYALAAREEILEPEIFGLALARHFIERNPRLQRVRIDLTEHCWKRIVIGEREHGQSFMRRGPDSRTATVQVTGDGAVIGAGVRNVVILKSSHSAFAGYLRDAYTTLPETHDRLLATALRATWRYRPGEVDFGSSWQTVRRVLLETFAKHDSRSVQHTLYDMGQAVLDCVDTVSAIRLVMPNKHHLPVDVSVFGLENRNEIFVATEEPHGLIEATITREHARPARSR